MRLRAWEERPKGRVERAQLRAWSRPQGLAGGRERQGRVQEQAQGFVAIVADGAQAAGLGMGRVVERGGVLGAEHQGMG